jgi:hypothetical protein
MYADSPHKAAQATSCVLPDEEGPGVMLGPESMLAGSIAESTSLPAPLLPTFPPDRSVAGFVWAGDVGLVELARP